MDKYLTAFLIGFSLMFSLHYLLEATWSVKEPRPTSKRLIFNYAIGTLGICMAFLYLHVELWFDLLISVLGAGSATVLAHGRDWFINVLKRDQANGLIEGSKEKA